MKNTHQNTGSAAVFFHIIGCPNKDMGCRKRGFVTIAQENMRNPSKEFQYNFTLIKLYLS